MIDLNPSVIHTGEQIAACPWGGKLYNCEDLTNGVPDSNVQPLDHEHVISMDGWFKEQRRVVVVNGTIHGPTLTVNLFNNYIISF